MISNPTRVRSVAAAMIGSIALIAMPARAFDEAGVIARATEVLERMADDPDAGVPIEILRASEGVILFPNLINAGLVVGAKYGHGVFLTRDSRGRWGNPVLVTLAGGTLGLQAGGQATEALMLFRKKEAVAQLLAGRGKVTLGVDAGVAAGPSGTSVGAETDIEMRAEILTYAKSRGLYAGASFGGASIRVDRNGNGIYYDNFAATTFQVVEGDTVVVPIEAGRLKATLETMTRARADRGGIVDEDVPSDPAVARTSAAPRGRVSTRRRRPIDDGGDASPPPTRQARASTRRRAPVEPEPESRPDDRRRGVTRSPAVQETVPTRVGPPEDVPDDDPTPPGRPRRSTRPTTTPPVSTSPSSRNFPDDPGFD